MEGALWMRPWLHLTQHHQHHHHQQCACNHAMSAPAGACHQRIVKSMQRPYRASSVGHHAAMHASNHVSISKNTCKQSHEKHYERMHDRTPAKRLTSPPLPIPIASASKRSSHSHGHRPTNPPAPATATGHRIRQPCLLYTSPSPRD